MSTKSNGNYENRLKHYSTQLSINTRSYKHQNIFTRDSIDIPPMKASFTQGQGLYTHYNMKTQCIVINVERKILQLKQTRLP